MSRVLMIAVLAATGCQVDLEVDEVRLTYRNIEVKGAGGHGALKKGFAFDDLSALQDLVDQGAEISFVAAELHAMSGIDDMSFVERLQITVASGDPDATIAPLVLVGCEGSCKANGRDVVMKAGKRERATEYLASGSLLLDLDLAGKLPSKDWTLDFDVVLDAKLAYALDPREP